MTLMRTICEPSCRTDMLASCRCRQLYPSRCWYASLEHCQRRHARTRSGACGNVGGCGDAKRRDLVEGLHELCQRRRAAVVSETGDVETRWSRAEKVLCAYWLVDVQCGIVSVESGVRCPEVGDAATTARSRLGRFAGHERTFIKYIV